MISLTSPRLMIQTTRRARLNYFRIYWTSSTPTKTTQQPSLRLRKRLNNPPMV